MDLSVSGGAGGREGGRVAIRVGSGGTTDALENFLYSSPVGLHSFLNIENRVKWYSYPTLNPRVEAEGNPPWSGVG